MLSRDSEDEMWSRFMFELLIWPQEVTLARWTQPSGPLCLWQCLSYFLLFLPCPTHKMHIYLWKSSEITLLRLKDKGKATGTMQRFLNTIFDSQSSDTNSFACCLTEVQEKGPSCKSLWPALLQTTALNWCYITPVAGLYNTSLWQQFFGCLKKIRPEMKDRS